MLSRRHAQKLIVPRPAMAAQSGLPPIDGSVSNDSGKQPDRPLATLFLGNYLGQAGTTLIRKLASDHKPSGLLYSR
jgi:hypothetical protein